MANRAISGARASIYVGETRVAWCTDVNLTIMHQNIRVDVLGNIHTEEIEPVGIGVNGTIGTVRILKKGVAALGLVPTGTTKDIITFPASTMILFDEVENEVLGTVRGARIAGRTIRLNSRSLMMEEISIEATRFEDPVS